MAIDKLRQAIRKMRKLDRAALYTGPPVIVPPSTKEPTTADVLREAGCKPAYIAGFTSLVDQCGYTVDQLRRDYPHAFQ